MATYTCRECGNKFNKILSSDVFFHTCDSCKRGKESSKLQKKAMEQQQAQAKADSIIQNQQLMAQTKLMEQQQRQAYIQNQAQEKLAKQQDKLKEAEIKHQQELFDEEKKQMQEKKNSKVINKIDEKLIEMSEEYENHFLVGFLKENNEKLNNFIGEYEDKFIDIKEFINTSIKYEKIDFMGWKKSKLSDYISKFKKKNKLFYFYNQNNTENLEIDSYIFIENDKIDDFEYIISGVLEIVKEKEEKRRKEEKEVEEKKKLEKRRKVDNYNNVLSVKQKEIRVFTEKILKIEDRGILHIISLVLGVIGFFTTIINDVHGAIIGFFFLVSGISFITFPNTQKLRSELSIMQGELNSFIENNKGVNK